MLDSSLITIPLSRYDELLSLETKVDIVVERLMHSDFFDKEAVLWILGTELSVELAEEMYKERKRNYEEWEMKCEEKE